MAKDKKISASDEAWDTRELGSDEEFVKVSEGVDESKLDESIGLVPVSIRLHKSLIEDFRVIARLNGTSYQPLMRQVLWRFADCEKKKIIRELLSARQKAEMEAEAATETEEELKRA